MLDSYHYLEHKLVEISSLCNCVIEAKQFLLEKGVYLSWSALFFINSKWWIEDLLMVMCHISILLLLLYKECE